MNEQVVTTSETDEAEGHRIVPLGEEFGIPPNAADARRRSALQNDDDEEDDVAAHSLSSRAGVPPTGMDKVAEDSDD